MSGKRTRSWDSFVQYRWECDECGEPKMVAVLRRGERVRRLCRTCHQDGHWRKRT